MRIFFRAGVCLFSVLLIASLLFPSGVEAKRDEQQPLIIFYNQVREMPPGPERTSALESLLERDTGRRLGVWPAEELAYAYIAENNEQALPQILDELRRRESTDHSLKRLIAQVMYSQDADIDDVLDLLNEAIDDLIEARRRRTPPYTQVLWETQTSYMIADINSEMAHYCFTSDRLDDAYQYIYLAMANRTAPEDYQRLGQFLFSQLHYREAMGAIMFALYRGNDPESAELFQTAYDSLGWDNNLFDSYLQGFRDLYLDQDVAEILNNTDNRRIRDLPNLPISDIMSANGCTMVFWGDYVDASEWSALQELSIMLNSQRIPHKFVYVGENMDSTFALVQEQGYSFPAPNVADSYTLSHYNIDTLTTVLILGPRSRIRYRVENVNQSVVSIFEELWNQHTNRITSSN